MMLSYNEAVHTYIGSFIIATAAVGAFFVDRPGSPAWRQHTWLVLALFLGWIVMGSNESFTPPADGNVWWVPIEHLFTGSGSKSWWDAMTSSPHVLQHKVAALCIVTPAVTEWFIRRRPEHRATPYLRWVLPLALAGVGLVFILHRPVHRHHAGHDPAAMQAELYQHYVFSTAFLAAAVAAVMARLPTPRVSSRVWYAFMALGGLVFVTFRV